MTRFASRRRLPSWLLVGTLGAVSLAAGQAIRVFAADPSSPVVLIGTGDSDVMGEMIDWQDALAAAGQPTDTQYFQRGSRDGRSQLLRGQADFAISGVPFTDAELAARPAGSPEVIATPLSVGSIAVVVSEPPGVGWVTRTLPCTVEEYLEGLCDYVEGPPLETIRIPPENLSALITAGSNRRQWTDPGFAAGLGTTDLIIQQAPGAHTFLNRTEGASQNKYLMEYAKTLGPLAWAETLASDSGFKWDPIGEVFSPRTPSKFGLDTQIGSMSLAVDPISGQRPPTWTGNMGPVPTTLVPKITTDFPQQNYRVAEIQNANGDWVLPTRETIDAALAAGTEPIIAARQMIPGAYPLVYINKLYTVAGSLTPDEANSLAAFVRYVVTDGQQLVIDDGATDLPAGLRAEALAQADLIVSKNCSTDGYEVTISGPSAFEPVTPGVQAIGSMSHCTLKPVAATTTSSSTTTSTTVATSTSTPTSTTVPASSTTVPPSEPSRSSSSPPPAVSVPRVAVLPPSASLPPTADVAPPSVPTVVGLGDSTTTTTVSPTSTTLSAAPGSSGNRPRGIALSQLPMVKPPTGAEGATRLGTLLLGASIFLGGRRLALSRRSGAA